MSFHLKIWKVRIGIEVDRVHRVDGHAVLAREESETVRVVRHEVAGRMPLLS